ncbi:undecaprenyl-phosphate glucose phosphotransferase [Paucidesulfovibrio longus]|uniref:undecaprenyl-phosphate glucose phosphotransferase n=1 Tax=Paucidesulfovibrio longus TaxID=889 RepID=UPI0003B4749B|nr:undecaprenyl-phosphate glucose phosphotransferase [Paucidesulfovibrio longus]
MLKRNKDVISFLNYMHKVLEGSIAIVTYFAITYLYLGRSSIPNQTAMLLLIFFVVPITLDLVGAYRIWRGTPLLAEYKNVCFGFLLSCLFFIVLGFSFKISHEYSRVVFYSWALTTPVLLCLERFAKRMTLRWLRRNGRNMRTAVIIGAGDIGSRLGKWVTGNAWLGIALRGFFDDEKNESNGFSYLGSTDEALDYIRKNGIDIVYLALPMTAGETIKKLTAGLSDTTASVFFVPDVSCFALLISGRGVHLGDISAIALWESPLVGVNLAFKQLFDFIISLTMLILLSPLLLVVALLVKLSSPGPVLFKQIRYGLDGKTINVFKFRTMRNDLCDTGDEFRQATKGDPRVTRIGAILRKTSIDELPQLFNVLQGTMSLVGPRPHPIKLNEHFRTRINGYMLRHKIKPGITGWAQVNGYRGETDTPEKMEMRIKYDLEYLQRWSLALDFKIICRTAVCMIGSNAY